MKPDIYPQHESRLEQEYFFKKEKELIEKLREERKLREEQQEKASHTNHCGFCGSHMIVEDFQNTGYLFCESCESVHINLADIDRLSTQNRLKKLISAILLKRQSQRKSA